MRRPADWMQPMDDRILEALQSSGLILSPAIIAYNIDMSREAVTRRLKVLSEHGLVNKVERGKYEIRELGEQYLEGEIDAGKMSKDGE